MKGDGFSLIELLTVMVILGIVAAWGTVSYQGWRAKHDMEKQIRETYADIANLRVMAKTKGAAHFMSLGSSQLRTYEDTTQDGALDTGSDQILCLWERRYGEAADSNCSSASVSVRTLKYPVKWSGTGTVAFDSRGLATQSNTICIDYTANAQAKASYDCIDVSTTRVALGSLINKEGACSSANCQAKR